jgi:hypothetical protein
MGLKGVTCPCKKTVPLSALARDSIVAKQQVPVAMQIGMKNRLEMTPFETL